MLSKCTIDYGHLSLMAETDFTKEQIDYLRELICSELIEEGFEEDDNPNQYGLFLENLIDDLGHYL